MSETGTVLHIIPTLDQAGAEKQLALLAGELKRRGWPVHVCALTRGGPYQKKLEAAGVPVTVIGKATKLDPFAYLRLRRFLRQIRPDIVQTWLFAANAYGRWAAWRTGVPHIVASERCADYWKSWWHFTIDRFLARRSDAVVVNGRYVQDFYASHGIPRDKIVVIPNAVLEPPLPSDSRRAMLLEFGLPDEARVIALVGRLWPQKRVEDAIWAADLLKRIRDDVHLLVIGDGPLRERLIQYRDQIEIADRVHFVGHRTDLPRWLPHFDVLWNTSAYEGQSNAVLEAMACGVPVVAADIPGNRELIVPDETGFLVPAGKSGRAPLAAKTKKLLEDEDLRRRMGEAARRRARDEFSLSRMADAYCRLYEGLLSRRPAPARSAAPCV